MPFSRPAELPFPSVWHGFEVNKPGQRLRRFKIQDLTEDMEEEAVSMLLKYFTTDEPPCKYIEVNKHPIALRELEKLWRTTIKDRVSLVCLEEQHDGSSDKMVGVNVLTVACKDQEDEPFHTEDETWAALFGAVDLVTRSVDIYDQFGVDSYLAAYGLVVPPEYRGLGVGTELLKARVPLCKALGIHVTATVFTAAASQVVAARAGYITLFEITYTELAKHGFVFPGIENSPTKYSKLMAFVIE